MMKAIGLDGNPVDTDKEIYDQLRKVWDFWVDNNRSIGFSNITPENKEASNFLDECRDF